jgi:hypothetical protein
MDKSDLISLLIFLYSVVIFVAVFRQKPRWPHKGEPVYLEVRPFWTDTKDGGQRLSIEVVNGGVVPVTVQQVGFKLRDQRGEIAFIPVAPGDILPKHLYAKPLTLVSPAGTEHDPAMKEVICAFARTSMGSEFTGTSPALQDLIAKAGAAAAQT